MTVYTVLEHDFLAPQGRWTQAPERVTLIAAEFFDWLFEASEQPELKQALRPEVYQRQSVLKAQQYVGLIQSPGGDQLEILPKTTDMDHADTVQAGRSQLLRMLGVCPEFPQFLPWQTRVGLAPWPLWQHWITQMLEAVAQVVRHGLRSSYGEQEGQQAVLRGRLLVAEQVRHNSIHRERLYCRHSVYTQDRTENRLLHRLLHEISRQPLTAEQQQQVRQLRLHFEGVEVSRDWQRDWRAVRLERGMASYRTALDWLYWWLTRQMPITTAGSAPGWSLLLDMNRLFEQVVAQQLRQWLPQGWRLIPQAQNRHLLQRGERQGQVLRPDLLLAAPDGTAVALLDTKWKRIDCVDPWASQAVATADLYQMKAYATAYLPQGGPIVLIYPQTQSFRRAVGGVRFSYLPQYGLQAVPFDADEGQPDWWVELLAQGSTAKV